MLAVLTWPKHWRNSAIVNFVRSHNWKDHVPEHHDCAMNDCPPDGISHFYRDDGAPLKVCRTN
jgi:hypothetical protein